MILRTFKNSNYLILIALPITAIILWLKMLLIPQLPVLSSESFQMPLYTPIYNFFHSMQWNLVPRIVALLLLIIQAFLIVRLNTRHNIFNEKSFLPALLFVLISSSFMQLQRLHPIYFSNIFLILAIDSILSSQKKENAISNFFDASLLISIGSLFYVNMIFLFFLTWISLIAIRPFKWREWIVTILGFAIPFVLAGIYSAIYEGDYRNLFFTIILNLVFDDFSKFLKLPYFILYGYLVILSLLSSYYVFRNYKYQKITTRNTLRVYLTLVILCTLIVALVPVGSMEILLILSIPLSEIISSFLHSIKRNWISNTALLIIIGLITYIQIVTPIFLTK